MQLAERLKAQRLALGLTQKELATQSSLTRSAIGGYELTTREPDLKTTPAYLVGWDD